MRLHTSCGCMGWGSIKELKGEIGYLFDLCVNAIGWGHFEVTRGGGLFYLRTWVDHLTICAHYHCCVFYHLIA